MDTRSELLARYRRLKAELADMHDQAERLRASDIADHLDQLNDVADGVLQLLHDGKGPQ
jgi:hypothetical protein